MSATGTSESPIATEVSAVSPASSMHAYPSLSQEDWDRSEKAFNTYRRELPRLLQEGHAGRFALIVGEEVLSVWDTTRDAAQAGYERFGVDGKFCIHEIKPQDVERFRLLDEGKVRDFRRRPPCRS